jgi:predicted amidohydrolase YtcJ
VVRVVGGWSGAQFAEKRLPTVSELNAAAPDAPVLVLHLYQSAILNRAAVAALGYGKDTPDPPRGQIVRDHAGNPTGVLLAAPAPFILYGVLGRLPVLDPDQQVSSTRHFLRELNRFGSPAPSTPLADHSSSPTTTPPPCGLPAAATSA